MVGNKIITPLRKKHFLKEELCGWLAVFLEWQDAGCCLRVAPKKTSGVNENVTLMREQSR